MPGIKLHASSLFLSRKAGKHQKHLPLYKRIITEGQVIYLI